jgi:DNA-binding transcriptional ArsR family regulator
MAAPRPSKRRSAAGAVATSPSPANPQVRDYARPGAGFAIEWDVRTTYDFLFSLTEDAGATEDLPPADRAWLTESRAAITGEAKDDLDALTASSGAIFVAAFAVEHPELTEIDAFIDAVEATPNLDLLKTIFCDLSRDPDFGGLIERAMTGDREAMTALRAAMPDHKSGLEALLEDPEAGQRAIVRVLRSWAVPFAKIEPRIKAILERDHALRAADRGAYSGSELIERTTGGIRWLPEVGIRRVVMAPSYFSRPYNFLLAGDDWRFFGYPVADDALEPDDRLTPPPAVVRLHRALGDETRLRMLKLLAGKDLYLTEIAQELDLSKPTIKHHLATLRAAGLVTVVEAGSVIYYSLRRDRIEAASSDLAGFLLP